MFSHLNGARHVLRRMDDKLHVIAVVFNPLRFVSRYNLYNDFAQHAIDAGAELWTVELAFGDRPFEVTQAGNPRHIQYRTDQELWHKERMINEAVKHLPRDWKYAAWVDADLTFVNPDWVHETVQQLQHYQVVQMFTHAIDIGPQMDPIATFEGFAYSHQLHRQFPLTGKKNKYPYQTGQFWHPGYAWAYRREAWDNLNGMLDINIVGGGDHQMAYGLIGAIENTIPAGSTPEYARAVYHWADRAQWLKTDIGSTPGTLMHHFHGHKANRGYYDRWKILTSNHFNPYTDLMNDRYGMLRFTGHKPQLRDDLRDYFRARNEDSI
jgi:hypothetical protein